MGKDASYAEVLNADRISNADGAVKAGKSLNSPALRSSARS